MASLKTMRLYAFAALALFVAAPLPTFAQTDEIQVYNAEIAPVGVFNLTWHNNFTPDGLKVSAFPGGIIPDHSFNGVTEWAYGVTDWFEAGLYLPLYSVSKNHDVTFNGGKIRLLFVSPHAADRTFFYGCNFEFSYNRAFWDKDRFTSEIRPILGVHLHPVDIIVNPILDNSWRGGFGNLDFAPAARIAYNFTPKFALATEEYSDVGPLRSVLPTYQESHEVWGVFDRSTKLVDIEGGVGFGVTPASDKITLKLILSRDLNSPKH
ncbi:MAG TPA: hypothetical protein VEJ38_17730 [Candidatus Acidoferrales bacterium]|nr:hypothetical protein [Candidatus Acidoferrales bacterium]